MKRVGLVNVAHAAGRLHTLHYQMCKAYDHIPRSYACLSGLSSPLNPGGHEGAVALEVGLRS